MDQAQINLLTNFTWNSFTRHFYKPPELQILAQISVDILALEQETEGLLSEIAKGATA